MTLQKVAVQGDPTGARTIATGVLGSIGMFLAVNPADRWTAFIPTAVGLSAKAWTWLVTHGGILGVLRQLLHGDPVAPQP